MRVAVDKLTAKKNILDSINKKLMIINVENSIKTEMLEQYFSKFGKIEKAYILYHPITNEHRGFGFLIFTDIEITKKVLEMKYHVINGVEVIVKKNKLRDEENFIKKNSGPVKDKKKQNNETSFSIDENTTRHENQQNCSFVYPYTNVTNNYNPTCHQYNFDYSRNNLHCSNYNSNAPNMYDSNYGYNTPYSNYYSDPNYYGNSYQNAYYPTTETSGSNKYDGYYQNQQQFTENYEESPNYRDNANIDSNYEFSWSSEAGYHQSHSQTNQIPEGADYRMNMEH